MICQSIVGACPLQPAPPLNLTGWFAKPKPSPLPPSKQPSGERLKVLHLSDFHIDPRAFSRRSLVIREDFTDHVMLRLRHGLRGELHDRPLLSRKQS